MVEIQNELSGRILWGMLLFLCDYLPAKTEENSQLIPMDLIVILIPTYPTTDFNSDLGHYAVQIH